MEKKNLISALAALVRPTFNASTFEAEYLTKAFAAANGDPVTFGKAVAAKAAETAKAEAAWNEANAEIVKAAEAAANPYIIICKVLEAKAEAETALAAKVSKVTAAKTAEAKAKAETALAECRAKFSEALALAEALAEALAFVSDPSEAAKAEALKATSERLKAEAAANTFNMYWDSQNADGTRKTSETGVYYLPSSLGFAEAAANCLLSHSVFAEAAYRKAKAAEALENCLTGLDDRADRYIDKGGYIEALNSKFDAIIKRLEAKAKAKAEALAAEALLKFERIGDAEEKAEATAKAAALVSARTAKGKKLAAEAAKALRAAEAAKTAWDVFVKDHPNEAETAEATAKAQALSKA